MLTFRQRLRIYPEAMISVALPAATISRAASLSCVCECKCGKGTKPPERQTHEASTSDKPPIENESGIIELEPAASPTSR